MGAAEIITPLQNVAGQLMNMAQSSTVNA
jgi:hypothetical protein